MNNEPTIPTTTETITTPCDRRFFPSLCWGAIIGGTVAAIGIQILLSILGTGAGLAIFTPMTDNDAVKGFSEGAAAIWSICALVAIFFGAVIAGRFSHSVHGGFVHGILVWCLTLIISLVLITAGTGKVMGGVLKVLGEGLGIGGKAVAAGAGDLAKEGVKRSSDQLGSFIDEAVQSVPTNAAPKAAIRAKREIGFAVTKLFAPGNDINSQDNRTAVIKSLMDYTQMSEADATKTVDDWMTSYKNLKAELDNIKVMAEQKAKVAADEAAHNLSITAIWAFFGLLLGLLVSVAGGILGADHAMRRVKVENVRSAQLSAK
jgi:hypothetical protein